MTRAIWIQENDEVISYPRLKDLGMTHIFFSARSITRAHINQVRRNGLKVGIYSNPQWYGAPSTRDFRDIVRDKLTELNVNQEQCDVQFNIEKTGLLQMGLTTELTASEYVIDLFHWWLRSNRQRVTSWTMEGFQGGWFARAMVHDNLLRATLVPQAYDDKMNRWDSFGVTKDLVDWGVSFSRILPFYPANEARIRGSEGFFYMDHLLA